MDFLNPRTRPWGSLLLSPFSRHRNEGWEVEGLAEGHTAGKCQKWGRDPVLSVSHTCSVGCLSLTQAPETQSDFLPQTWKTSGWKSDSHTFRTEVTCISTEVGKINSPFPVCTMKGNMWKWKISSWPLLFHCCVPKRQKWWDSWVRISTLLPWGHLSALCLLCLSVCLLSLSLSFLLATFWGAPERHKELTIHILLTCNHCLPQRSEKQYKAFYHLCAQGRRDGLELVRALGFPHGKNFGKTFLRNPASPERQTHSEMSFHRVSRFSFFKVCQTSDIRWQHGNGAGGGTWRRLGQEPKPIQPLDSDQWGAQGKHAPVILMFWLIGN